MTEPTFAEIERKGWSDPGLVDAYAADYAPVSATANDAMIAAAGLEGPSDTVDLCCGPGLLTAALVAAGHRVRALDFSPVMVDLARRAAPGAEVVEGDATALPYEDDSADAVFMALGIFHMPDPAAALAEAARVLRPGGQLVISIWEHPDRNPAFELLKGEIETHGRLDALGEIPDFFLLTDPAMAERMFHAAGLATPEIATVPVQFRVDRPEDFLELFRRAVVRMGALLDAQSEEAMAAIAWAIAQQVRVDYPASDGFAVPATILILSAPIAG